MIYSFIKFNYSSFVYDRDITAIFNQIQYMLQYKQNSKKQVEIKTKLKFYKVEVIPAQ